MRTMVLEYIYQHLPQKWPSFVGKNTISPWFASGNGVRSAGRWVFLQCPGFVSPGMRMWRFTGTAFLNAPPQKAIENSHL